MSFLLLALAVWLFGLSAALWALACVAAFLYLDDPDRESDLVGAVGVLSALAALLAAAALALLGS